MKVLRLPFDFDPMGLAGDLAGIGEDEWVPHFNQFDYEGDWSGVALRSTSGQARQLYPDPSKSEYLNTPVLARSPYLRSVLDTFHCPVLAARLLRLAPGSKIREHRDHCLSLEDGEFRVHVPVQTSPEVIFLLAGEPVPLTSGTSWYLNVNHPHSVDNGSSQPRVHLVFDCVVNPWVLKIIAEAKTDQFFRSLEPGGLIDSELQSLDDPHAFAEAVAMHAAAVGIPLSVEEVRETMTARRHAWATRIL